MGSARMLRRPYRYAVEVHMLLIRAPIVPPLHQLLVRDEPPRVVDRGILEVHSGRIVPDGRYPVTVAPDPSVAPTPLVVWALAPGLQHEDDGPTLPYGLLELIQGHGVERPELEAILDHCLHQMTRVRAGWRCAHVGSELVFGVGAHPEVLAHGSERGRPTGVVRLLVSVRYRDPDGPSRQLGRTGGCHESHF